MLDAVSDDAVSQNEINCYHIGEWEVNTVEKIISNLPIFN